ncbi:hypothetical protein ACUHMQ_05450 [Chitinimonas sp. PSY-7]
MKHAVSVLLAGLMAAKYPVTASALEVRTPAQDSQPKFVKEGETISGLCVDVFQGDRACGP